MKIRTKIRAGHGPFVLPEGIAAVAVLLVLVLPLEGQTLEGSEPMPTEVFAPSLLKSEPHFVSLEVALEGAYLPNGDLRSHDELGLRSAAGKVSRKIATARPADRNGCNIRWRQDMHYRYGRETLGAAVTEAESILKVTVTGIVPGLVKSSFGNLYRVRVDDVIKDPM